MSSPRAGHDQDRLFRTAEQWFERGRAALQNNLPCRHGCTQCCHGPFAITILDRRALQRGLETLPPAVRATIVTRAQAQCNTMESAFPRLSHSAYVDDWRGDELDELVAHFSESPCPALDVDGSCLLYAHRPITCRVMGLPVEADGLIHGACGIQTSVPLIQVPRTLREEEADIARQEAELIAEARRASAVDGEEILLPYGFVTSPIA